MGTESTAPAVRAAVALIAALLALGSTLHAAPVHHQLAIELDPATSTVFVVDEITLPEDAAAPFEILLNSTLELAESSVQATSMELGDVEPFLGNNGGDELAADLELRRFRLAAAPGSTVTLGYRGRFDFELSDPEEEYTRGFRSLVGRVAAEGVYLAGGSFWYPHFGPDLVEFDLEVRAPEGWQVISQGEGTSRGEGGLARWSSQGPMDEIDLVGGPLEVYRDVAGAVETQVYLRERDDALARKYLDATAQYLEMYRQLIGPYPYGKFALVENFWETGYGMPSFTLLGPQVIRFPFILHSSYPHEILHNWWGNSVFVDYAKGNWCEGLTAYLADHLIQEQRGKGAEYRRNTLQKYRNYVSAPVAETAPEEGAGDGFDEAAERRTRDFPLLEFRSRHNAATEAVGYGKTLMVFHMLRLHLGDEGFTRALRRFYREQRGHQATFEDLRVAFESIREESLRRFFDDWTARPGAPELGVAVDVVRPNDSGDGWLVEGSLDQLQAAADRPPFLVDVPVVVRTTGGVERRTLRLTEDLNDFVIEVDDPPVALDVDPEFDAFRLLDPREIPPSIGQIFGEPEIVAVLPSAAGEEEISRYRSLVEGWQSDSHAVVFRFDSDVEPLPADRAVWLLGRGNLLAAEPFAARTVAGSESDPAGLTLGGERVPFPGHSLVVVRRHPGNAERAMGWLVVEPPAAFPGLGRKLPHYGKYSYLGFEGDEPTNVVKGQWPTGDSPLRIDLRPPGENLTPLPPPPASDRRALAELPPVFSQRALLDHVAFLASPEREGRAPGSEGHRQAAAYIAEQFRAAGLEPGGDGEGYFQEFEMEGPASQPVRVANVIGVVPGSDEARRGQSALVTAHYDHLGRGWPDVRAGNEGRIHPGADDNASGVAVLLELARVLASERQPRTLVFVAFTAEEADRLGSRFYVENPLFPLDQVLGVINVDTVGRLGDAKLRFLGTGTADEWPHVFRGTSFVTGIESLSVPGSAEGSDQQSFIEMGVPAVQVFTGAHDDYHRPSDTADQIDGPGLVKVATFLKEAVAYLGQRDEPFRVRIEGASPAPARRPGSGRRVLLGTVPDFAFPGPGVRLDGTTPDSPADQADLREGDIVLRIDDVEIANLRSYSEVLKTLEPGQTVRVTYRRGTEEKTAEVTVVAR